MRKFGLIGHPLGHSLSPQIHTRLFKLSGETVEYKLYDIAPEELESNYPLLRSLDGFNITIPHKVGIIPFCASLSDGAKRYGSVNCVKNGEKPKLIMGDKKRPAKTAKKAPKKKIS